MHKHICILIKVYLVSISVIHKNSISNQMGVADGRTNRVTRLVTCNKDVYLRFLSRRAFISPYKAYFRMMMTRCCAVSKMGVVDRCGH